jgi:hypothetical protein
MKMWQSYAKTEQADAVTRLWLSLYEAGIEKPPTNTAMTTQE